MFILVLSACSFLGYLLFRLQNCSGLYHNLHCNILLVEYRGYGLSEGTPSEEGLYTDAKSSLDYLFTRNDINHSEIVVFGRSLGKLTFLRVLLTFYFPLKQEFDLSNDITDVRVVKTRL